MNQEVSNIEPTYTPIPLGIEISDTSSHPTPCPVCTRGMLLRPRTLSKHNIINLREIYRVNREERRPAVADDIHTFVESLGITNGKQKRTMQQTYTELKYWELIEAVKVPTKNIKGEEELVQGWKITEIGASFLNGKIRLPERIWVFNDLPRINPNPKRKTVFITVDQVKEFRRRMNRQIAAAESEKLEANEE